jgi:hypothetical protein
MGSENAHGCAQNAENFFSFDFLEQCHEVGNEFVSRIIRVTGDDTWVLFLNVETKEQSKQWMCTYSPNKRKKLIPTSPRKLITAVSWDRKGVPLVVFMQQGTTMTSKVYCETLINCVGPFRIKGVDC